MGIINVKRAILLAAMMVAQSHAETLFASKEPQMVKLRDGVNYELGMRFTATSAGQIKGIRFYKSPSESGRHIGRIFSSSGRQLASVTFSNETASGWQQAMLSSPLSVTANTEYTVTVNTGNQYYVATNDAMGVRISSGNLRSVAGNNGVYGSRLGARPTQSYRNSNYFRDVIFAANSVSVPEPQPVPEQPAPEPNPAPTPAPPASNFSGPPLSFDDARFNNTRSYTSGTGVADGGSLTDASIKEYSGDATVGCQGSCKLTRVRIDSRECVRAVKGNIVIADSYLEATGAGDDHADVIQAYGPGNRGTLTLRNTSIVAHNTAATAGIFVADYWKVDLVDLENVMFKGGPYGLRLHADGYTNAHLRMKNVCFVGPFGFNLMLIDGFIIDEWTNVNECVIQNGQLVVTKAIARPN